MACAKKCDRCSGYYELYNVNKDDKNINGLIKANIDAEGRYFSNSKIDLCPKCKKDFDSWLDMK